MRERSSSSNGHSCNQGKSKYLPGSCCPTAGTVRHGGTGTCMRVCLCCASALLWRQWDNSCEEYIYFFLGSVSSCYQHQKRTCSVKIVCQCSKSLKGDVFETWSTLTLRFERTNEGASMKIGDRVIDMYFCGELISRSPLHFPSTSVHYITSFRSLVSLSCPS